jgi:N-acetylglucosamine-6-phosphate deacetylase
MEKYCVQNGIVFGEEGEFEERPLYFAGEQIISEETYRDLEAEEVQIDAHGCYVIPGLTDIHFHGCVGYDCCDGTEEALKAMADYELRQGVTSITPATMTMPAETLEQIARTAAGFSSQTGADLLGLYMEGPFINKKKKGAQKEEYVRKPDLELFEHLQQLSNHSFRTVVVAPETEGAMDFIRALSGKVNISLGHMLADYETASEAMECGATELTHLYNAMPPLHHRNPGPIGAGADHETCRAELICDGIHIHPSAVRAAFRMFGDDRIILISDSMRAAGIPDGESELGGQKVFVKGKLATLEDGTIAGSVTNLMDCMRTAVKEMKIPLASAVKCAAVNPVKAIGLFDSYGSLTPGKIANVVLLDQNLDLVQVYHRGQMVE